MPSRRPPHAKPNRTTLTHLGVTRLKPRAVPYLIWDERQRGLAVRVEVTGYAAYKVIYRHGGRPRWYHIAAVDAIKLSAARDIASDILYAVAKGKDPAAHRRAERAAGTFDDLADRYLEHAKKRNRSWRQADWLVRTHLRKRWGKLPAADVSRSDVRSMMTRLEATPVLANQVLAAASAIFSWAVKQEVGGITVNPCSGVERNATKDRERKLGDTELVKFWMEFGERGARGAALRMILLTGARPGEVAHMRPDQVVDGWWQLPGDPNEKLRWPGTKNKQSHALWLSTTAHEVVSALQPGEFVFAGGYGAPVFGLAAEMAAICAKLKVERCTPHDLRRTAGSTITRLGFGREAMDRVLNHRRRDIASVYDRHQYYQEDQRIMQALANHYAALLGQQAGNVVAMPVNVR
jgi:integrase